MVPSAYSNGWSLAAVLLVKGEGKELALHLPGNGGLQCPPKWCLVILAPS